MDEVEGNPDAKRTICENSTAPRCGERESREGEKKEEEERKVERGKKIETRALGRVKPLA